MTSTQISNALMSRNFEYISNLIISNRIDVNIPIDGNFLLILACEN